MLKKDLGVARLDATGFGTVNGVQTRNADVARLDAINFGLADRRNIRVDAENFSNLQKKEPSPRQDAGFFNNLLKKEARGNEPRPSSLQS